jgi:hypothetical protein
MGKAEELVAVLIGSDEAIVVIKKMHHHKEMVAFSEV